MQLEKFRPFLFCDGFIIFWENLQSNPSKTLYFLFPFFSGCPIEIENLLP